MFGGFNYCIQSPDMGNQSRRIQSFRHHGQGFFHIIVVAAAGAYNMRKIIMHIIKIRGGLKLRVTRTGKEVQASVEGQDGIALFNNGSNRRKNKYIIESFSIGKLQQILLRDLPVLWYSGNAA